VHRFLALAVLSIILAAPLVAQDTTKVEVFGGYQYLHVGNADGGGIGINANGWDTSATFGLRKHFGLAVDVSGSYKTLFPSSAFPVKTHLYTYTFGPVVSWHSGLFVHVLIGGARVPSGCVLYSGSPDECGSGVYNGLATMLGGGLDVRARKSIASRVFQLDWVNLPFKEGGGSSNFRFATGLVVRF
jgi:hypothetical protein